MGFKDVVESPRQGKIYPMIKTVPNGSFLILGPKSLFVNAISSGDSSCANLARLLLMKTMSFMHHPTSVR